MACAYPELDLAANCANDGTVSRSCGSASDDSNMIRNLLLSLGTVSFSTAIRASECKITVSITGDLAFLNVQGSSLVCRTTLELKMTLKSPEKRVPGPKTTQGESIGQRSLNNRQDHLSLQPAL